MSLYSTPGSSMLAKEIYDERLAHHLDNGTYRNYGGRILTDKSDRQHHLRTAAIIALICAPFSVLIAPLIAALVLGHYTLRHTNRDAAMFEDRTRGIAMAAIVIAYVSLAVMLLGLLFSLR